MEDMFSPAILFVCSEESMVLFNFTISYAFDALFHFIYSLILPSTFWNI